MILFIGGGKMGGALIQGLLNKGHDPENICLIDPALPAFPGIQVFADFDAYVGPSPSAVILAVKPQIMEVALAPLTHRLQGSLLISIAAGKSLAFFQALFGPDARLVRAMPNLPAAVGAGMTGWYANGCLNAADKALTQGILSAMGTAAEVASEDQIDAWTAIAGSGPGYAFHLLECLQASAERLGFDPALAKSMAQETLLGAARLAVAETDTPFATLRENVTSPGGTTAAGLAQLMPTLPELIDATAQAAYARAKELAD